MAKTLCALMCIWLIKLVASHTYHTGSCPSVEPMAGFEMNKFLGNWYAIQKSATASTCLVYTLAAGDEPNHYKVEQTSQHFILGLTPLRHTYRYTGEISLPDADVPGKMQIKFPLSVAGSSSFTVFMTDYETYAGIFSCQKLGFFHRRSATLLSRTRSLDKMYIDKMRTRLSSFLVDPFDLSIINQTGCPNNGSDGYNISIDQDTFSAHNVANVFRKAGDKIADGVEYTVEAGKKLYHVATDDNNSNDRKKEEFGRNVAIPDHDPDAEWVRF